jgi:hypothetical protein
MEESKMSDGFDSPYEKVFGWKSAAKILGRSPRYVSQYKQELMDSGIISWCYLGKPPNRIRTIGFRPYDLILWERAKRKKGEKI